jgi:hypothetical protein
MRASHKTQVLAGDVKEADMGIWNKNGMFSRVLHKEVKSNTNNHVGNISSLRHL